MPRLYGGRTGITTSRGLSHGTEIYGKKLIGRTMIYSHHIQGGGDGWASDITLPRPESRRAGVTKHTI